METMQSYQDIRFSFRIHMSLVSTASQPLMDKCEVERNPISLAAVKLLGDVLFVGLEHERQCPNPCPIC